MLEEGSEKNVSDTFRELKDRLADVEEHRRGLLEHSHNLEHLLKEASKHSTGLEQQLRKKEESLAGLIEHLGNLEHLLKEKESDLKQTKEKMKELEARCYRYEQMLADEEKEYDTAETAEQTEELEEEQ